MFGRKEDKQIGGEIEEQARQIVSLRFLDSNCVAGITPGVVYSFVATYRDGHCEILEGKADDPLLRAVLPKLF